MMKQSHESFVQRVEARLEILQVLQWYRAMSYEEQYALLSALTTPFDACDPMVEEWIDKIKMALCSLELQGLFTQYEPTMVSISDLDRLLKNQEGAALQVKYFGQPTQEQKIGDLRFFVFGPQADTYILQTLPCFIAAIFQGASQTNNLEFPNPNNPTDPIHLSNDRTQGPALQKGCPILALARYRYWQTHQQEESFLRNWLENTVSVDGRTYQFNQIFSVRNGYLFPKQGMVGVAIQFVNQHRQKLLINWEEANNAQTGHRIVQVLAAALAIGYSWEQYTDDDNKHMDMLCRDVLKIMYEIIAKIAILEAQKNPNCRVPLVLTLVGGGVFTNSLEHAVFPAVKHAISLVRESGVMNIDIGVSGYKQDETTTITSELQKIAGSDKKVHCLTPDELRSGNTLTDIITQKEKKAAAVAQHATPSALPEITNQPSPAEERSMTWEQDGRLRIPDPWGSNYDNFVRRIERTDSGYTVTGVNSSGGDRIMFVPNGFPNDPAQYFDQNRAWQSFKQTRNEIATAQGVCRQQILNKIIEVIRQFETRGAIVDLRSPQQSSQSAEVSQQRSSVATQGLFASPAAAPFNADAPSITIIIRKFQSTVMEILDKRQKKLENNHWRHEYRCGENAQKSYTSYQKSFLEVVDQVKDRLQQLKTLQDIKCVVHQLLNINIEFSGGARPGAGMGHAEMRRSEPLFIRHFEIFTHALDPNFLKKTHALGDQEEFIKNYQGYRYNDSTARIDMADRLIEAAFSASVEAANAQHSPSLQN